MATDAVVWPVAIEQKNRPIRSHSSAPDGASRPQPDEIRSEVGALRNPRRAGFTVELRPTAEAGAAAETAER